MTWALIIGIKGVIMDRFVVACCVFSFIVGVFVAVQVEQGRGCTIEVTKGQVTTVTIGRVND